MSLYDIAALLLVLYVIFLKISFFDKKVEMQEMRTAMVYDQAMRNFLAEFSERQLALSPKYMQQWLRSLLVSWPIKKPAVYIKELYSQQGWGQNDLFGQMASSLRGRVTWIISGYRENLPGGECRYIPVHVTYIELPGNRVVRCAAGGMGNNTEDEYELREGNRDWRPITEAQNDEFILSMGSNR